MNKQLYKTRSFTLVEVIFASAVAAITIAAAVSLINVLQWGMVRNHRSSRALAIANSRLEALHAAHFVDLPLMQESSIMVDERGVPSTSGIYLRSTDIGAESMSYRRVEVTVTASWKPGLPDVQVALTTFIADPQILRSDL